MPILNRVVRAIYRGVADGQEIVNIHDYRIDLALPATDVTDDELQALAAALGSQWVANILPILSESYVFQETRVQYAPEYRVIRVANPHQSVLLPTRQFFSFTGSGSTGGKVGDRLPLNDAVTARKITATFDRSGRGSTRFGPIPEADQLNGSLTDAAMVAWLAATTTIPLPEGPFAPGTGTFELSVWGPASLANAVGTHPVDNAALFRVTSFIVKRLIRTQLSRKPKF